MPTDLKPIKTGKDYTRALALIDKLMDTKPESARTDVIEVLSILIEKYEEEHFPIAAPDPVEAIKFRMEQMGVGRGELAKILGGKNRVSEILNRKRKLTVVMIKKLSTNWKIPAESLL